MEKGIVNSRKTLNLKNNSGVDYPDKIPSIDVKDKRGVIEDTNIQSTEESEVKPFENQKRNLQNIRKIGMPQF
tara:strand:+ start:465 stop:683 length:219 start_codon:yes stop_codon:yes gene_type:complete